MLAVFISISGRGCLTFGKFDWGEILGQISQNVTVYDFFLDSCENTLWIQSNVLNSLFDKAHQFYPEFSSAILFPF